jgi:multiple sugar transport system substrate-binding protein
MTPTRSPDYGTGAPIAIGFEPTHAAHGLSKRRYLSLTLPAFALCACGIGDGSSAPATSQGPKTVIFHTDWTATARGETVRRALEQWAKENPTIQIDQQPSATLAGQSSLDGLVARLASDTIGDVALWEAGGVELWGSRNAFADIGPALKKMKYKLDDHYYHPGTIFYQQKQVGMPFQFGVTSWAYNRTLFRQKQMPEPQDNWTWDDLVEAAKRLTEPDKNVWGLKWQESSNVWQLIYAFGGEMINKEHTKSQFDTPATLAGVEYGLDLINKHRIAPTLLEGTTKQLDQTKGNYGVWSGGQNPKGLQTQAGNLFEVGFAPLPMVKSTGKKIATMSDQPHVVMLASQKHGVLEEAAKLAIFMTGDFVGALQNELNPGGLPTKKSYIESSAYLSSPPANARRILDSFKFARADVDLFPTRDPWLRAWRPFMQRAMNGEMSAREFAQQANAAGDAALAKGPL